MIAILYNQEEGIVFCEKIDRPPTLPVKFTSYIESREEFSNFQEYLFEKYGKKYFRFETKFIQSTVIEYIYERR